MAEPTDQPSNAAHALRRVRMAYTLNNRQPVRCTLVSEEPLFYLDNITAEDDDFFGLDLPVDLLADIHDEQPLLPLIKESAIDAIELFKRQFSLSAPPLSLSVQAILGRLSKSRLAQAMIANAEKYDTKITEQLQIETAIYDRMQNQIILRTGLPVVQQLLVMTRELRRAAQHRQGALIHPLLFHPDHAVVINRVQSADLMTMMVRVAWELRLAGDPEAWDYLDQNGYQDMTRSLAREALGDFRSLNNGRAMAAAFESWFLSERCRGFDRSLIQNMLADYQSYIHKAGHQATSKVLTHQLVAALGAMPYGNNYLAPYAVTILADPIFTEVRDRSNANFLWFIKFEQSFRQTERDLQEQGIIETTTPGSDHAVTASILAYRADPRPAAPAVPLGVSPPATVINLAQYRRPGSRD